MVLGVFMFFNQIIGTIVLSIPLVFGYQISPNHLFRAHGIALSAFSIGAYVAYTSYTQSRSLETTLKYAPTGDFKQRFEEEVRKCGMDPKSINLRYSYLNDTIASSAFNTLCIDPLVWQGVQEDGDAQQVQDIIERHVLPSVPEESKKLHNHIRTTLSSDAQNFIFRHELGHTYQEYSKKHILSLFGIAVAATMCGVLTSSALIASYGGFIATLTGMIVGGVIDTGLGYVNNALFKVYQERSADNFAAQFSSAQEIRAAADFFEKYETVADEIRKINGLLAYLPVSAVSGHPEGAYRAAYLRAAADKKAQEAQVS